MVPVGFICALLGVASRALLPDAEASVALPMILMSIPPVLGGITLSGLWAADINRLLHDYRPGDDRQHGYYRKIPGVSLNDRQKHILNKVIVVLNQFGYLPDCNSDGRDFKRDAESAFSGDRYFVYRHRRSAVPKFSSRKAGFWTIMA